LERKKSNTVTLSWWTKVALVGIEQIKSELLSQQNS